MVLLLDAFWFVSQVSEENMNTELHT